MRRTCVYTAEPAAFNLGSISHCYTLYPVYAEFVCEQAVICGWALSLCCVVQNTEQLLGSAEDQPRSGGEDPPERECLSPCCVSVCVSVYVCVYMEHPSIQQVASQRVFNQQKPPCLFLDSLESCQCQCVGRNSSCQVNGQRKVFCHANDTHKSVCVFLCVCRWSRQKNKEKPAASGAAMVGSVWRAHLNMNALLLVPLTLIMAYYNWLSSSQWQSDSKPFVAQCTATSLHLSGVAFASGEIQLSRLPEDTAWASGVGADE